MSDIEPMPKNSMQATSEFEKAKFVFIQLVGELNGDGSPAELLCRGEAALAGDEQPVSGDDFDSLGEGKSVVQAEPFAGVTMPVDIEAIAGDPVQACEGRIKLFASVVREARPVALKKAILGAVPFAENVDGIVELRRLDSWQVARLEDLADQSLTCGCDWPDEPSV